MSAQAACPICSTPLQTAEPSTGDYQIIDCFRCGKYIATRSVISQISRIIADPDMVVLLSFKIRKMQGGNSTLRIDTYLLDELLKGQLPNLSDQMNNLILWLGDKTNPGHFFDLHLSIFQSLIGAKTHDGVDLILNHLSSMKLIQFARHDTSAIGLPPEQEEEQMKTSEIRRVYRKISLTMTGWEYYDKLKRGAISSRKAFMAMKFGDSVLDNVFANYFRPAVKDTGFDLYRLDEQPRAGLIDDRLRVEIRTSRFLISDLTHENPGAYWEAGFAEGLGKPVIYTCEKEKFEKQKTHFDTNHHLTIIWDKDNLELTVNQLKATIRATLPDETILNDIQ